MKRRFGTAARLGLAMRACAGTRGRAGARRPRRCRGWSRRMSWRDWQAEGPVVLLDVRTDVFTYLKGHLPGAEYLNTETHAGQRGRHPDPAALRAVPIASSSPGWASPSTGRW